MIVANFMDSSLHALRAKGNFDTVPELYNPQMSFERVIHFTPFAEDADLQPLLDPYRIRIVPYRPLSRRPWVVLRVLMQVIATLRRERVELVRGRLPYLGSLLGCLAARLLGLPSVVSLGGNNRLPQELTGQYHFGSRRFSYFLEWLVLRLCTRIIAPNTYTQDYVGSVIGTARANEKTVIIPWPSERVPMEADDEPDVRAEFDLRPNVRIVPIIGFINKYKFSNVLFDALDDWSPGSPDSVVFLFCGDGPLRSEGETRFARRRDVRFVGWQPRATIHALIRQASVVVIPMSGFVLLEAASAGRPVVSSQAEWHSELIDHGKTGHLVDPFDKAAWRTSIEQLLTHSSGALAMGAALKEAYERDYAPEVSRALELELYRDLLGPNGV